MTAPDLSGFAARFRMALAYADVSAADVAQRVGVSRQLVSDWCKGKSTPRLSHLVEALKSLGVPLDWIMRPGSPFSEEVTIEALRAELRAAEGKLTRAGITD